MDIVFATQNLHKLEEIRALLGDGFHLIGLQELNMHDEIPEDHPTLEGNALQKAWYIYDRTRLNCFADDTGLEVDALNGEPGVFSARYSRMGHPTFPDMEVAEGNIRKLLMKMEGEKQRSARFRTVIALVMGGKEYLFEGVAEGWITESAFGARGFGYDPVFRPRGYEQTFAEMDLGLKNRISHRAKAVEQLVQMLKGM